MYKKIVEEFSNNPRDIHTVPIIKRESKWFFVFVNEKGIFVESAHYNEPKSQIKKPILLRQEELEKILMLYHRRMRGESVSLEAQSSTRAQVYWYGIFFEMNL